MKNVIGISGGKDSLALLYLLRDKWAESVVIWVNSGAAYDDTVSLMAEISEMVPHFEEVRSDQPAHVASYGWPADIVPAWGTTMGHSLKPSRGPLVQPFFTCCATNLWGPFWDSVRRIRPETIYLGQKRSDKKKSPPNPAAGFNLVYPLEDWTDAQVIEYLGDRLPEYYRAGEKSSHDCWDCTAFVEDNRERIRNLPDDRRAIVMDRLYHIKKAALDQLDLMDV